MLGNLHLTFQTDATNGTVSDYRRELNLNDATTRMHFRRGEVEFTREMFVSAPDEVMVLRLRANRSGGISFVARLDRPERFETVADGKSGLLMTGQLDNGVDGKGVRYAARVRVLNRGGEVAVRGNALGVQRANEVVLLITAATDYQGFAGRQTKDPVALTLNALFATGYTDEAHAYMAWLKRTTAGRASELQIMYGVGGERLLPEVELEWLEGYRGSRPVRIGNGAAQQFQLDTFGELLDTAWLYRRHGGEIDEIFWDFLSRVGGVVLEKWREPDQGIWEIRGEPKHFVYSKVMAWVALDRLVKLAEEDGREGEVEAWRAARDEIRELIEAQGVDPETGAFVQSFGSSSLDASNLMIPIVGFVSHDDPRARATADRIADELSADGFVYRYVTDGVDGLSGDEATFANCSFWLVECLARAGETERARELFERLLGFCNDVGLLAEEIDPHSGELIGNFPQAFSHLGLIQAAIALDLPELSMSSMESGAATEA